jgi:hypothetical protein
VADTLSDRVTRLEVMMENLGKQIGRELEVASSIHVSIDKSVSALTTIVGKQDAQIQKVDQRLDRIEVVIARAAGAVAVVVLLANILVPQILKALGLAP